jgi:hypothetical protein
MKEQIGELRIDEAIIPIIKGDLRFHLIIVLKVFLKISLDSKRVKIDGFLLYIVLIFDMLMSKSQNLNALFQ